MKKNSINKMVQIHKYNPEMDMTFKGLSKWYVSLFEKLGWMVLAYHEGRKEKVDYYIESLVHFLEKAEHKYHDLKSLDKKKDVMIMIEKVKILLKHAEDDFS